MGGSLPDLIKFYRDEKSPAFEILAFHDGSVKSMAELEEKLEPVKKKRWGGQDLPFPVLLDQTGETLKRFEIGAFPTLVLIDPEGRLVGHGSLELLQKALRGELEAPGAKPPSGRKKRR